MSEINLLKTSQPAPSGGSQTIMRALLVVCMVLLVAVIGFYAFLFFQASSMNKQAAAMQNELSTLRAEASANKQRNELLARQGQLKELGGLVDNHRSWSLLLPELARVTLKSAKYTSIMAKDDGTIDLTVNVGSYAELDKFMQIFDLNEYNKQFSNVKVLTVRKAQEEGKIVLSANIELTFNPDFLKKKS